MIEYLSMERRPILLEDTIVPCAYLPNRVFRSENFLFPSVSEEALDELLILGYRHFGYYFFRPHCKKCYQCIPLRLPVEKFTMNASFRRIMTRNSDVSVTLEKPNPTEEAFALYKKHKKKFGSSSIETYDTFLSSFFYTFGFSYQLTMRLGEILLGVSHLDITDSSISSIYCYYDTDYTQKSLGSFAILKALEIAQSKSISHLYLGYYIDECSHMNYKIRFRPNQALLTEGKWKDFTGNSINSVSASIIKHGFRPKKRFLLSQKASG